MSDGAIVFVDNGRGPPDVSPRPLVQLDRPAPAPEATHPGIVVELVPRRDALDWPPEGRSGG